MGRTLALQEYLQSGAVYATAIQVQDFQEEEGDRLVGRNTLPIVSPGFARVSVIFGLACWTLALSMIWEVDLFTTLVFLSLAFLVGARFLMLKIVQDDRLSFFLYNVSCFSFLHVLDEFLLYATQSCRCGYQQLMLFQDTGGYFVTCLLTSIRTTELA